MMRRVRRTIVVMVLVTIMMMMVMMGMRDRVRVCVIVRMHRVQRGDKQIRRDAKHAYRGPCSMGERS